MKLCELCKGLARMYCESDNASLCWDCDDKVHSANFLAARHSRSLLCHVCQSPTAWSAAGAKIGKTVSVCDRCRCVDGYNYHRDQVLEESESINDEGSTGTEDEETDYEDDEEDLQVVPWSSTPPPPPASSSSSEHSSNRNVSLKRMLEIDADLHSDDDSETSCCRKVQTTPSVEADGGDRSTAVIDSFSTRMRSPAKIQRTETDRLTAPGCTVIEFIRRNNRPRMIQGL